MFRKKFTFIEKRLEEGSNINLLTVARLTEKKGIEYSLQAVAKLMPKYPRLFYRIAGEGELRAELEALATQLGDIDMDGSTRIRTSVGEQLAIQE